MWKAFSTDPATNKDSEREAFRGLGIIVDAVRDAALRRVPRLQAQTTFNDTQGSTSEADNLPGRSRPNGCFVRVDAMSADTRNPHRVDIAATVHYKKNGTSLKQLSNVGRKTASALSFLSSLQNISEALWSMHRTMREDASRRFAHVATIENRTMRLWFASRSEILVSESFDFMDVSPGTLFGVVCHLRSPESEAAYRLLSRIHFRLEGRARLGSYDEM